MSKTRRKTTTTKTSPKAAPVTDIAAAYEALAPTQKVEAARAIAALTVDGALPLPSSSARLVTTEEHYLPPTLPPSQLDVLTFVVSGDDQVLQPLIPFADAELRNLFEGPNGTVMGFSEEAIHASAIRVLHRSTRAAEMRDEPALAASAFSLGFMLAARLFGGVQ